MKQLLFFCYLFLAFHGLNQPEFQQTYTLDEMKAVPYDIQQTSDSGYVVVGYTEDNMGNKDMLILRLDSLGNIKWKSQFGGAGSEIAQSSMEDSFGNIYVTGYTYEHGASDLVYLKFDSAGNTIWQRIIGNTNSDHGWDIRYHSDSTNILIYGYSYSTGPGITNCLVLKVTPDGDTLFTKTYGGPNRDYGHSIKQIENGFMFCGHSSSYSDTTLGYENHDAYVIQMDTNFNVLWANAYGAEGREEGNAIAETADGDFVFVGVTNAFGNENDMMVIKIDSTGDTLWGRIIGTPMDDDALDVVVNQQNEILVAGYTTTDSTGRDITVLKLDQNGETLKTYNIGTQFNEGLFAITNTIDGNFAIAGFAYGFSPLINKFFAAKIDDTPTAICVDTTLNFFNVPKEFRIGPGAITQNAVLEFKTHPNSPIIPQVASAIICVQDTTIEDTTSNVSIEELNPYEIYLYPNPVENELFIHANDCQFISVKNSLGQMFYNIEEPLELTSIQMNRFPPGMYFITFECESKSITKKVIKN
jgi:hypothetical protein